MQAIQRMEQNPGAKLSRTAEAFDVSRHTLRRRLSGIGPAKGKPATHKLFSDAEEEGICDYIDLLDRQNLSLQRQHVVGAANLTLKQRASTKATEIPTVGQKWVSRFLQRYGYTISSQKSMELKRKEAENLQTVNDWFLKLQAIIQRYGIIPEDIWNMDESGFRIGIMNDQKVVTRRVKAAKLAAFENRESATVVETISAGGRHLPPFLIFKGAVYLARWYHDLDFPDNGVIAVTSHGYNNDETNLEWVKHFEKHTKDVTVGARRLLLINRFNAHHTKEFITFYYDHGIVPFGFPAYATHFLQPLDVSVFQPLKHHHSNILHDTLRNGCTVITKLDFVTAIIQARRKALTPEIIKSGFRKTGVSPFNP